MRLTLLSLTCLICTSSLAQSQLKSQPDTLDTLLRTEMQNRHIPGMQIAVIHHSRVVFTGAYGLSDVEHSVKVTNQTVFSIASITKAFTGVAIMQLVEKDKLSLRAPVSQYLSGLPMAWRAVTVQQLLTHVSGIPDIVDQKKGTIVGDGSPESFISEANNLPMEFAPGERFSYNQTNYLLLQKIIEKVSGESYVDFVTRGQLDATNMGHTYFGGFSDIIYDRAQPYALQRIGPDKDQLRNIFYESVPSLVAGNGINTSAEQIASWIIGLQSKQLLKADTSLSTMWTPGVLKDGSHSGFGGPLNGYALGWPVITRSTHRALAPIGGNWAALFIYPDDDLSIVILTNLQGSNPEKFVDDVAGYYVPDIRNAVGFAIPRALKQLQADVMRHGLDHVLDVLDDPRNKEAKSQLREEDVNAWGYRLVGEGRQKEALEIFKLNVALFPQSANVYDSLADAYDGLGNRDLSLRNYRRSLELNPHNRNAAEHIKALESDSGKSDTQH